MPADEGGWKSGFRHGTGKYVKPDGWVIEGQFVYGEPQGEAAEMLAKDPSKPPPPPPPPPSPEAEDLTQYIVNFPGRSAA